MTATLSCPYSSVSYNATPIPVVCVPEQGKVLRDLPYFKSLWYTKLVFGHIKVYYLIWDQIFVFNTHHQKPISWQEMQYARRISNLYLEFFFHIDLTIVMTSYTMHIAFTASSFYQAAELYYI